MFENKEFGKKNYDFSFLCLKITTLKFTLNFSFDFKPLQSGVSKLMPLNDGEVFLVEHHIYP